MRAEEARRIYDWVRALELPSGTKCLNIGSSTAQFRQEAQPHIHRELIAPLEAEGLQIVHCDMKADPGVDEVGDLLDPEFQARLRDHAAGVLICSNLLEHLADPRAFAMACASLVAPRGHAIVTVPYSYPYHADPIDTGLRPTPDEIAAMIPDLKLVRSEIVAGGDYWRDLVAAGKPWRTLANQGARVLLPFYRPHKWRDLAERLLWLKRDYTVSMALLQRPG